jgi:DUF4097 and DUF4098 domain-containing protein YvlB
MLKRKSVLIIVVAVASCCGPAFGGQTPSPTTQHSPGKASPTARPRRVKPAPPAVVITPLVPATAPVEPAPAPFLLIPSAAPAASATAEPGRPSPAPAPMVAPIPQGVSPKVRPVAPAAPRASAPEPAAVPALEFVFVQNPKPPAAPRPRATPRPRAPAPPRPDEDSQAEPVLVPLAKGGTVLVSTRLGDVNISGWDQDKVEASAESDEGTVKVETNSSGEATRQRLVLSLAGAMAHRAVTMTIKVPRYADVETSENLRGDITVRDVDGGVRIGAGNGDAVVEGVGALKIQRRGGDIIARNIKGEVFARGAQGDITLENAGKWVDVSVATGDLTIKRVGGDVRVSSATGDIDIRCVKGRADVSTASGSISLVGVEGDVEASTASGDVSFTGTLQADGSYRLKSISGEVQMTLPSDVPGFRATLVTYTGAIETDFPLKTEVPYNEPQVNRRITATYGKGGAKVTLDSFSGEVRISKGEAGSVKECK